MWKVQSNRSNSDPSATRIFLTCGPVKLLALALSTFCLSAAAISITGIDGRIAAIWPINAILLVVLLKHPTSERPCLLAAFGAGLFCSNLYCGDNIVRAGFLTTANIVEVVLASAIIWSGRRRRLISSAGIFRLFAAALISAHVSAAIAAIGLAVSGYPVLLHDTAVWLAADMLGMILFAPVVWSLIDRSRVFRQSKVGYETYVSFAGMCAVALFVFIQTDFPLLFLVPPALVLLAFNSGLKGVAIGLLAIVAISVPLTLSDRGPVSLMSTGMSAKILVLQLFLTVNSILALAVGAVVSERRGLLRQLQRSRAKLRTKAAEQVEMLGKARLAEKMSGVGHWTLNPATNAVYWSPEVYAIHGVSSDLFDPNYNDAVGFYHPDDREMVEAHVRRGVEFGENWEFEARLVRRSDGTMRRVKSLGDCIVGADGRVERIFGVFKDITDERQLYESLAEREAQYRMLAEHSTDIVVRIDLEGRITYASPSCAIVGISPEQALGRPSIDFVLAEDRDEAHATILKLFETGDDRSEIRQEFRTRTADGRVIWLEGNPHIIKDDDGAAIAIVSTYRDITDRRQREEALAVARADAEAAGRAKAEFLSNMSHEIRTPLNGVLGFVQLLAKTDLDREQTGYIERIQAAGRMLRSIVDNILDFSKIESSQIELDDTAFCLRQAVSEISDLVLVSRMKPGVTLNLEFNVADPFTLRGDETRVRQILTNLLDNAAKFTEQGEITVRVDQVGPQYCVTVSDTGVGIAADKLPLVFEPFRQEDASVTRQFGGTGLGLAISRSLAQLMGGDLTLTSIPGQQTTVRLTLPYVPASVTERKHRPVAARAIPARYRVMVVDDVELNLELIETGLSKAGFLVEGFTSARKAIAALEAGARFDLALMDVQMPEMDGLTATAHIRELPGETGSIPVVALTAHALPSQVEAFHKAGMNGHVAKPVDLDQLVDTIHALMTASDAPAAQPDAASPAAPALQSEYRRYLETLLDRLETALELSDRLKSAKTIQELAQSVVLSSSALGFQGIANAANSLHQIAEHAARDGSGEDGGELEQGVRAFIDSALRSAA